MCVRRSLSDLASHPQLKSPELVISRERGLVFPVLILCDLKIFMAMVYTTLLSCLVVF